MPASRFSLPVMLYWDSHWPFCVSFRVCTAAAASRMKRPLQESNLPCPPITMLPWGSLHPNLMSSRRPLPTLPSPWHRSRSHHSHRSHNRNSSRHTRPLYQDPPRQSYIQGRPLGPQTPPLWAPLFHVLHSFRVLTGGWPWSTAGGSPRLPQPIRWA